MINPGTSLEASQALSSSWLQSLCGACCAAQGLEEVSIQPHRHTRFFMHSSNSTSDTCVCVCLTLNWPPRAQNKNKKMTLGL